MILSKKNARRIWEPEEDKQLLGMVETGKSPRMIALRLKRTEMAVRQRLFLLRVHFRDDKKTAGGEPAAHGLIGGVILANELFRATTLLAPESQEVGLIDRRR